MLSRLVLTLPLLVAPLAGADAVNIGLISFDVLNPGGSGSTGVNVFDISNLTGDPGSGGFAQQPDFPAYTALSFLGSTLMLMSSGTPQTINLGTIAGGPVGAISPLEFPDTMVFSSAIFSATLSSPSILLADGTTFTPASTSITAILGPSSGPSLVAGIDFAVVAIGNVPEPGTFSGGLAAIAALILARKSAIVRASRLPARPR